MSNDSFKELDKFFSESMKDIEGFLNSKFSDSGNSNAINNEQDSEQIVSNVHKILEILSQTNNDPITFKGNEKLEILVSCAVSENEIVFGLKQSQLSLYSFDLTRKTYQEKAKFSNKQHEAEEIHFIQSIKDKRLIIVGYNSGNLRVFEIQANALVQKGKDQKFNHSEGIMNIQYLKTSNKILTCSYADSKRKDYNIKLWDLQTNNNDITISFLKRYQEEQYSANSATEIPTEGIVVIALSTAVRGKLAFFKIKEKELEKIECQNQYKVLAKNGLYWLKDTQIAVLGEEFLSILSFKNNTLTLIKQIQNNKINTNSMSVSFALSDDKSYLIFTSLNTISITSINTFESKEYKQEDVICTGNCCIFLKNGYLLVGVKKGFIAFKINYDFK